VKNVSDKLHFGDKNSQTVKYHNCRNLLSDMFINPSQYVLRMFIMSLADTSRATATPVAADACYKNN